MKRKSEGQPEQVKKKDVFRKRQKSASKPKQSSKESNVPPWPEHFQNAINTVLGFVSTRKQLATTFAVVKLSVESLLKQAILPDLIKFSYIPQNELRVTEDSLKGRRENSPGYSSFGAASTSAVTLDNQEDHILVLEFVDNARGKKTKNNSFLLSKSGMEDAVGALHAAAQAHVPVNPDDDTSTMKLSDKLFATVPDPSNRPCIDDIITEFGAQAWCKDRIIHRRTVGAKEALTATLEPPLSTPISQALLDSRKITSLYSHQVAAIQALAQGKHVIVSTSTASGKSVIYQVPVLRFLEEDPHATAIFVYPTKALAQDQKLAMEQLLATCPGLNHLKIATYDGDTSQELRAVVRETSSIIFTNFDMIHASILPHEDIWRRFLRNIKLMAVDELHYYSGLFGSHVAQILRRLRRVCAAVGNHRILFVSCSATIASPKTHMTNIFGIPAERVEAVTEDGAPSGVKDFLVWNPPYIDERVPSLGRHSSVTEATRLMRFLMKRGIRVILFCKIRKAMKTIRADLSSEGRFDILERTMPYRGGYSREDRRQIEQDAFNGRLLGIVATNALELGVDIGILDAVIMLGFPMTIASFVNELPRQQAGRAGRRSRDSLTVLVADSFPVDQHYVAHPEELFDKCSDDLIIDLESKPLLEAHLQCAAQEMPLSSEDGQYFGALFDEVCKSHLVKDQDGWYHTHPKFLPFPSKFISIRGAQEEKYAVVDVTKTGGGRGGSILEEVEISRAMFEVYEGGVVKEVSHDSKIAHVIRADVNWMTSPRRDFTNIDAVQTYRIKEVKGSPHRAYYGKVDVEVKVFGFFKIRNKVILEAVDLDTPAWQRETTGYWIDVPKSLLVLFLTKGINPAEAIHAAQHAVLNRFSMAQDLKTECKAAEKEYKAISETKRKRPARLIFYDTIDKGGGVAAKAFDSVNELLRKAYDAIEACDCDEGCVQSPACKEGNLVCSKLGAHLVLKCLLGLEIDPDNVPMQGIMQDLVTVVEAQPVRAVDGVRVETS
ncbi:hypothetical protein DXG01_015105 [Tephrocybe rancida]|nr:hypothetical protein DXG01_015105 [Tephrocybe rancida]